MGADAAGGSADASGRRRGDSRRLARAAKRGRTGDTGSGVVVVVVVGGGGGGLGVSFCCCFLVFAFFCMLIFEDPSYYGRSY